MSALAPLTPFVGVRNAQLARRRSFHTPTAHRCSHPGYVLFHLVVPSHSRRYAVLILWLRGLLAYVYAMAEQGRGWTQHFLSLIADLCFPATLLILCSIRYYQGRHLNCDQNLAGRPSYSTHAFPLSFFNPQVTPS
jgi:hypothetical protein